MGDDLFRSIEEFLQSPRETVSNNQCAGCAKILDGVTCLEIHVISEEGCDQGAGSRVCSWACMAQLAPLFAGRAGA